MDFAFFLTNAMLGVALAMDAFSVSLANGLADHGMRPRRMCLIAGIFAFFQALMPFLGWSTYAPFREELRRQVNEFIRTTDLIDGYIDFDAAVREEGTPDGCRAGMLSADHLHPAADGHRAMAEAVPEALLR